MKLDFSVFHDLMHTPFSGDCRGLYPHGWKAGFHHLWLDWQYRRRDQVLGLPRRLLLCPFGRHRFELWWQWAGKVLTGGAECKDCLASREMTHEEWMETPEFLDRVDGY